MHRCITEPRLVVGKVGSVVRGGELLSPRPLVIVHPATLLTLRTEIATLSLGPLSAIHIPANTRCHIPGELEAGVALWLVDDAQPSRAPRAELVPRRVRLKIDDFAAVLDLWSGRASEAASEHVLLWLRRDLAASTNSRNGCRPSLESWKLWSATAARVDEIVWAARGDKAVLKHLKASTSEQVRRAVTRILGMSPREALLGYRRRRLLSVAAERGEVDEHALRFAGYSTQEQCRLDFEITLGETPTDWLRRHGYSKPDPLDSRSAISRTAAARHARAHQGPLSL